MKFGDYLRQIREKNGWTQPEAAARAEIEQSYLSKLETGKSYPSEDIFSRLVRAYDMDVADMSNAVFSAELDKLRDVAQVRSVVLARQKGETRFMRGWLIAGLALVMVGSGLLGMAISLPDDFEATFRYRSAGVIKEGESPALYDFVSAGDANLLADPAWDHILVETIDPDNISSDSGLIMEERIPEGEELSTIIIEEGDPALLGRLDYRFRSLTENNGDIFIEKVEGGYRKYTLFDVKETRSPMLISLHFSFGFMCLFGGIACFYIARRWR